MGARLRRDARRRRRDRAPQASHQAPLSSRLARVKGSGMDVRNVQEVTPEVEHNGTVPVWWLIRPREMHAITDGGYLELANEFEVPVGGEVFPHSHPTHEFYFMMSGHGTMIIGGEHRDVQPGDLIYI